MTSFKEMDIQDEIKQAIEDMGFESPTPIQHEVIPLILDGQDVIAQAPTGTGKTCAFGIPVLNNINVDCTGVEAVILCPTRELVIQTEKELKDVAKYNKDIRIISIYGGQNIDRQLSGLRKKPQVVIGTTGRVMDHLRRRTLKLNDLKILVLDEVDEMLNMGFREDIDVILTGAPKQRQTVLFSATMPKEIVEVSRLYQINPVSVKTQHKQSDIPKINQYYVPVAEQQKVAALVELIKGYSLSLIFCNTKKRVDELNAHLNSMDICCDALHGDLRQHSRDKTMKRFREGQLQALVATDVAARGIDVDNIEAVFNFDIPHDEEYYVHRIGRTARANEVGDSYTFVTDKQMYAIKSFERYTKTTMTKAEYLPEVVDSSIDKKLFDKTLKTLKRADLTTYKQFILAELEQFRQKYEDTEVIDIAAALLAQLNERLAEANSTITLSPASRQSEGKKAVRQGSKAERQGSNTDRPSKKPASGKTSGVRYFVNVGSRDGCDSKTLTRFISQTAGINTGNIKVSCLDNYSFASITGSYKEQMEALNGLKLNKRVLAVEIADKKGKRD